MNKTQGNKNSCAKEGNVNMLLSIKPHRSSFGAQCCEQQLKTGCVLYSNLLFTGYACAWALVELPEHFQSNTHIQLEKNCDSAATVGLGPNAAFKSKAGSIWEAKRR